MEEIDDDMAAVEFGKRFSDDHGISGSCHEEGGGERGAVWDVTCVSTERCFL